MAPNSQPARLAPHKVRLIQVAKRRLGLEDADYRNILFRAGGVHSSRDLDESGFSAMMDILARLGFESTTAAANFGRRAGFATPAQVALMRHLWAEYTDGNGTDAQLGKWLEMRWHVSALRFLPIDAAPKVITALKAMASRGKTQAGAHESA
jgi:hypothetical protein